MRVKEQLWELADEFLRQRLVLDILVDADYLVWAFNNPLSMVGRRFKKWVNERTAS